MRDLNMCLLDRNWEKDRQTFDQYLNNFIHSTIPICSYICPEGTTLTRSTHEKSLAYASKSNRPHFEVIPFGE